ncbi:hypothetical protein [Muricoccus radiodurans]|uniref:hypothetical protein n=1 Tax=Muricoccus radiodurans TaxID=2231721 RepID=UPI003CEF5464
MTDVTITYVRGNQYVENTYTPTVKELTALGEDLPKTGERIKSRTAHGLLGELWVHGLQFETIERMDNMMAMEGNRSYPLSSMYYMEHYSTFVMNPWLGLAVEKVQKNILFHPASVPSEIRGCVGVGFRNGGRLEDGVWSLMAIYEQIGGRTRDTTSKKTFTLRIEGQMKALRDCTKAPGG